jgi:hypothetical protein
MSYQGKVYRKQGGDELVIAYGGLVTRIDSAGAEHNEPAADLPGAVVAGKCTAVEELSGIIHKTVLTLGLTGSSDLDLAGDADNGTGIKIYDFPAGRILLLGAIIDASAVCNDAFNASPNDVYKLGAGSVSATQAAEGDLTSTEQDIIPATTIDTQGNTVLTNDWHNALGASAQFDGTSSALDLYINAAVLNASTTKAVTIAITGTLTLYWINLGDY